MTQESVQEGYRFLKRLTMDFESGVNCFNQKGESLFAAYHQNRLVGIGGINIDPYEGKTSTGRVRRLYIREDYRNKGVGRLLMSAIEDHAKDYFDQIQLFTDTPEATEFYLKLGYQVVNVGKASHKKVF
ncbi:GNAT family N-acetyltransferase [Endozoicomonas arenosclerae]|uniref:GNAT family N-acetyltransferase n=1 Tax=Endozoicomonas arenosclerae TaxID=1633495 RepID=UPI0007821A79|nr:GNAT family N-acetyltransferase [Endozoicomonas arenosclerae]